MGSDFSSGMFLWFWNGNAETHYHSQRQVTAIMNGSKGILTDLSHSGGRSGYQGGKRWCCSQTSFIVVQLESESLGILLGSSLRGEADVPWTTLSLQPPPPQAQKPQQRQSLYLIITFPMMLPTSCRKNHKKLTSYSRRRKAPVTDTVMHEEGTFRWS